MSCRRKNSVAIALASSFAASAIFSSAAQAYITVGNWETGGTDGWFDWQSSGGGFDGSNNPGSFAFGNAEGLPSSEYSFSTLGATLGTYSLANMPLTSGSFQQNLSLKTQYETDSEGNSEEADAANSTMFAIDVTYNSAEWSSNTTYTSTFLTVNFKNAAGTKSGFLGLEPNNSPGGWPWPTYDTGNAAYPGGWDPTDYAGITTRTMIWDYGDYVPATIGGNANTETLSQLIGTAPQYLEFILETNSNGVGTYYYDNARLTNPQINATFTAMASPNNPYNWGTLANWSSNTTASSNTVWASNTNAIPSNAGDIVNFGTGIPADITETIDLNETQNFQITVGTLNFDNPSSSYVIDQGAGNTTYDVLTLNGDVTDYTYSPNWAASTTSVVDGPAEINDEAGNHTISAPIYLATDATIAVGRAGDTFTISGDISGATGNGITLTGTTSASMLGTVVFSGVNSYTGGTTVNGGKLVIAKAGALPANSAVSITGGTLQLALNTDPAGGETLSSLSISPNGVLDVGNNHIFISDPSGSIDSTIRGYLTAGYNGGGWNSASAALAAESLPPPPRSRSAPAPTASVMPTAPMVSSPACLPANSKSHTPWPAMQILTARSIPPISAFWPTTTAHPPPFGMRAISITTAKWTAQDFGILAVNYGQSAGSNADVVTAADWSALDAFAAANGMTLSQVPEPTTTALMAAGILGVLVRSRHRVVNA